ncbi:MAG: AAA family ATPase [Candidatus Korarchaeota archaeon]|nr:AAA family ATPase [Thermoproteota archaeon]
MLGVGIVGMPGSGKSALGDVARKRGVLVLNMGDVVREEIINNGLELTSENLLHYAEELRKKHGRGAVAVLVINRLKKLLFEEGKAKALPKVVLIEGLRSPEEKNVFEKFFDKFYVVAVHASPKTRYDRILSRNRPDDFKTIPELKERDYKELSFGIGELMAMADFHLVNDNKPVHEFIKECEELVEKILNLDC